MRKVLFVVNSLNVGGTENYLLRYLVQEGIRLDATVLCRSGDAGALAVEYKSVGVRVYPLRLRWLSLGDHCGLYTFLKAEKFDAVCDFSGDLAGLVLFVSFLAGVNTRLVFYRGSAYQFRSTKLRMIYAKISNLLVLWSSTKVLSNTEYALDNFHPRWRGQPPRYRIVRNGTPNYSRWSDGSRAERKRAWGLSPDAFVIGHVGRYRSAKNHRQLMRVAKILTRRHPDVIFLLCGSGVSSYVARESQIDGLNGRVLGVDRVDGVEGLLNTMDAFYFPSLNEGMPNALIEAMAVGLPFVASNIPAIKEVVPPYLHGYLVDPDDATAAVELLESFIARNAGFPSGRLADWVQLEFCQHSLYEQFSDELIPQG